MEHVGVVGVRTCGCVRTDRQTFRVGRTLFEKQFFQLIFSLWLDLYPNGFILFLLAQGIHRYACCLNLIKNGGGVGVWTNIT